MHDLFAVHFPKSAEDRVDDLSCFMWFERFGFFLGFDAVME